jgi:hypothetical protein
MASGTTNHRTLATPPRPTSIAEGAPLSEAERKVLEAIRGLTFGSVEVVVHDGNIVQLIRSEKWRPDPRGSGA